MRISDYNVMSSFVKWNDLNQFHEVVKSLGHVRLYKILKENDYKITYGTKIKIHGTNAAIRIDPDGKVIAQKRSSDIIPGSKDNHGFAAWVKANEDFFAELAISNETQIIYGEWAGPGVQNNVACSMTANKIFYVFSIDYHDDNGFNHRLYDPVQITQQLEVFKGLPDDVMVLPWHNELIIDFETKTETEKVLWQLNSIVEQIGLRDPFFFDNFGIEGCGEGLVCYPLLGATKGIYRKDEIEQFSHFNFKAKSEAHRVNKTKAAAVFDPEKFANKTASQTLSVRNLALSKGLRKLLTK